LVIIIINFRDKTEEEREKGERGGREKERDTGRQTDRGMKVGVGIWDSGRPSN
jgi:hypothetical protein